MQVVTALEMRHIDQRTIELYRVPGIVLMEHAKILTARAMLIAMIRIKKL